MAVSYRKKAKLPGIYTTLKLELIHIIYNYITGLSL